ncbi:MAG: SUMF1/EgtB/PvdO family nonheme iron enzyme [Elusimicrobia bacterium]|nr:SUMF1/EgtB/PvdO family nonheme iron enzyme [Elusimicrobiota bacterium]
MKTPLRMIAAATITAAAAFYLYGQRPQSHIPADLRDAVAGSAAEQLGYDKGADVPVPVPGPAQAAAGKKIYVSGWPADGVPGRPVEWVRFGGGRFLMGAEDLRFCPEARPAHEAAVKPFELSRTLVTVEQYAECVVRGKCPLPGTDKNSNAGANCNWGKEGRQFHPINCITWEQARQYARFKGARLPTETEWEFAATGGGRAQKYPWGDEPPTCARAVMDEGGPGCGGKATMPVCSRPKGNTAQGLCDMAGNVSQWLENKATSSYGGEADWMPKRATRGGNFYRDGGESGYLRAQFRDFGMEDEVKDYNGFRIARYPR